MTAAMRTRNVLTLAGVLVVALTGCSAPVSPSSPGAARPRELVVGTTTDSPPYATGRQGELTGLEVELAYEVGEVLGRPVRIVDMPWDELFEAVTDGRIDVVMAGVTITPERGLRFAFTDPYLRTGLVALIRRADRRRYSSRAAVCNSPIDIGVMGGTTGELYVRERCPAVIVRAYRRANDAVLELTTRRIDAVVHDGPVLAWLVAQHTAELELVRTDIANQELGWAVRRDNLALRDELNGALATLRGDGTLDAVLQRWVPNVERIRAN
jgi:polar amino acid transport system substrate-binding protein